MAASLWIGLGTKGWAVPGAGQLPGHGSVVSGLPGTTYTQAAGTNTATLTIPAGSNTAILWQSSGGTLNVAGSGPGFNVGSAATLIITAGGAGSSLLNVDTTGSPSYIMGTLTVNSSGGNTLPVYVANGSGIVVGPKASITAPLGLGLLGYDLSSQASSFNGTVSVAPTTAGSSVTVQSGATLNATGGAVTIAAPTVNVGIATPTSFAGVWVNILSGYAFTTGLGANILLFSPITNATAGATAGSITISGPASSSFIFPSNSYLLYSGNITTSGILDLSTLGVLHWGTFNPSNLAAATFTNNGTITWAPNNFHVINQSNSGSLVNNGSIQAGTADLVINVGGSITNNPGATIDGGGFNVKLLAGTTSAPGNGIGGGIVNHGTISGFNSVQLFASNVNGIGPYPKGGIFSDGTIAITNPAGNANGSTLIVKSDSGNVFLGGTVNIADPKGLNAADLSVPSGQFFTLGTNLMAEFVAAFGGSFVGPATITTETIIFDVTGNVNNRTGNNPLNNGFHLANGPWAPNTSIYVTANGVGKQAINLAINGNASVTSGSTYTFANSSSTIGGVTTPAPNAGSNLLVNASGI
ncbi:hypothetical protein IT6_06975 [Methylacidiphilum caldifontis]|uniref:beta strand repeat-containing protein n=1 Tax=Methylacidiphilum caldifontis TaxID=2795386 RepID=UPI001A8FB379|nr:hypothetical protein [Methylacidiphilum caldifontis]QSR88126.1 hypothetical protein IT6_06975 [Methylacidiphilum caldifontis]